MRVLIAEDDPISRLLLESTLKQWGHEPLVTGDGKAALEVLQSHAPPEIAILDWDMPEIDGPAVCRRFREHSPSLSVYIILLTGRSRSDDLIAGLAAGADDYIVKPFNPGELSARLNAGIRVVELQRSLASRALELELAVAKLYKMQQGLRLEALGRMGAGIAHEINTPTQYVNDNIRFFQDAWSEVAPLLEKLGSESGVRYLLDEVPKALDASLQGTHNIQRIVRAMRDFSPAREAGPLGANVNQAVEIALAVSEGEWKYAADLATAFGAELPRASCQQGELHQVLFHLIVNAAHAMADVKAVTGERGILRIETAESSDSVDIKVSDTGGGIRTSTRRRSSNRSSPPRMKCFRSGTRGRLLDCRTAIRRRALVRERARKRSDVLCSSATGRPYYDAMMAW